MDLVWRHPCRLGRSGIAQRPPAAHPPGSGESLGCGRPGKPRGFRMTRGLLLAAALLTAIGGPLAGAVEPSERLADPVLEARARNLSKELRCLVCQNQSIDDSNADLAHDLRVLLRQRLVAGDTDQQVLDYLASRY